MTKNRNIPTDQHNTQQIMINPQPARARPNWLGHSGKGATIDELLVDGFTFDQIRESYNITEQHARNHFVHLRAEHGLCVEEHQGNWRFCDPGIAREGGQRAAEEALPRPSVRRAQEARREDNADEGDVREAAFQNGCREDDSANRRQSKSKKMKKASPDFMGMVFETADGALGSYVASHYEFQTTWRDHVGDGPKRVLFLCCGPVEECVNAIVNQIQQVKVDLNANLLPQLPHLIGAPQGQAGHTYCYGYFDPARPPGQQGSWGTRFYIGVGTVGRGDRLFGGRWTAHVHDAIAGGNLPRHHRIRAWLEANPPPVGVNPREHAVRSGLARKLYTFSGACAEHLAFFTELFLISHAFGAHNLDNDTSGNCLSGTYFGVSQPRIFDSDIPQHVYCWEKILDACIQDPNAPSIGNTLVPGLMSLVAATFLPQLNEALAPIGLQPLLTVSEGRLPNQAVIYGNLNVSGAGDCMLSYQVEGRPYRIDLRFSRTDPSFLINMRPAQQGAAGRAQFIHYLSEHTFAAHALHGVDIAPGALLDHYGALPVRNANDWPFYKPMAYNTDGRAAGWFPISWPPGPAMHFPDTQIISPNWLSNAGEPIYLTLTQALELILAAFP